MYPPQQLPAEVLPGSSYSLPPRLPSPPLPPQGLSSILGSTSTQAGETWRGKADPSEAGAVTHFPQGCREWVGVTDPHMEELQLMLGCTAWLRLILFALVINSHFLRACLLGPTAVQAGAGDFLLSKHQALVTATSRLSSLSAAALGAARWRAAKGKPQLPLCKSFPCTE